MPKATTPVSARRQEQRHNPLEADLTATVSQKTRPEKRKSRHQTEGDEFVDSKSSRRILRIAQDLADEDEAENDAIQKPNPAFEFESRFQDEDEEGGVYEEEEAWGDEEEEVEEIEIAPDDLAMYNKFFPQEEDELLKKGWPGVAEETEEESAGTNLANLILEKIAAHEAGQDRGSRIEPGPIDEDFEIPEKVVEVYTK
jgi:essential nuclear protein 1